jgi:signal transduction histidine kinase
VRFTIADNGSGIPLDRQKKIFEPFFTTKEVVGTGLGLWVTKQIVDKHKATIRVRSKLGRGTVFSITFPTGEANMQAL